MLGLYNAVFLNVIFPYICVSFLFLFIVICKVHILFCCITLSICSPGIILNFYYMISCSTVSNILYGSVKVLAILVRNLFCLTGYTAESKLIRCFRVEHDLFVMFWLPDAWKCSMFIYIIKSAFYNVKESSHNGIGNSRSMSCISVDRFGLWSNSEKRKLKTLLR